MKVSDTGPLIILFKINKLWILEKIYDSILIPKAVEKELLIKEDGKQIINQNWIESMMIEDSQSLKILKNLLDDGEAETILLSEKEHLPVLLDEKKGRRTAKSLGLKVQGSLGTIVKAKKLHIITSVKETLEDILKAGYFIHPDLIEEVLKAADEK